MALLIDQNTLAGTYADLDLVSGLGAQDRHHVVGRDHFVTLQFTDGKALRHADLPLVQRVSTDHVSRSEFAIVWVGELGLSDPAGKEADWRLYTFLLVDGLNVLIDLRVIDEGHPGLEALLH